MIKIKVTYQTTEEATAILEGLDKELHPISVKKLVKEPHSVMYISALLKDKSTQN